MNTVRARLWWGMAGLGWLLWASPAAAWASQVDEIERALRGQPEAALQALGPVLERAEGDERLRGLLLRGLMRVGVPDEAGALATAAEIEALPGPPPQARSAAALVRAAVSARHTPVGRADRLLSEAVAALPATGADALRLRLLAEQAEVRQSLGRLDESVALLQQAVALADRVAPLWRRAELRSSLAYALHLAQQTERALPLNHEALRLAREAGDLVAQVHAVNVEAIFASAQGRVADELAASQQAIDLAQRSGSRLQLVLATANLADFHLKRAEYATALDIAQQALEPARQMGNPKVEALALANTGLALIGLGRVDEGSSKVREALLLEERATGLPGIATLQRELGQALEKAGRLPEAWAAYSEHRRLADELFQRQHQEAVLELQEGLDAERRQRELAALETENGLKEAQLEGRELQQRLWLLGALASALLLVFVGVLLRRLVLSNAHLRSSNAELKTVGQRDPLTGLSNRRHFQAVMKQRAAGSFEGSMLLVDLDHFKRINDQHGHAAGDAVLVDMARRLQQVLREPDLTVRWGGEEFLVVVQGLPPEQVEALAERLLGAVGTRPVSYRQELIPVTASIGFATFPLLPAREPMNWERALDVVDTALYLAKAHGRNRAYGVRALNAPLGAVDATPARHLESAWREGQAELAQLKGPAAVS